MDTPSYVEEEVTSIDGERLERYLAEKALKYLHEIYPRHPWRVGFAKETVFIKHDACDNRFGFILPQTFSESNLKEVILMGGGELLERAHLPRGPWNGEMGESYEK